MGDIEELGMDDPVIETAGIAKLADPRLLDVRDEEQFAKEHADGAVRVPVERWVAAARETERSFDDLGYWGLSSRRLGFARTARP